MKVLIAVPTFENITPDTFKSIYDLDKGHHEFIFEYIRGYDCAAARNRIVDRAKDLKVDYVFMVDGDIKLPHDAILNLLEDSKDVCLGYYAHRHGEDNFDGRTCICKLGEFNFTNQFTIDELKDLKEKGQNKVQIHGGGMGCALINMSVFNKIQYPWYKWVNYEDRHGVLSEDLYFCVQCNKNKIPIYVDTRVGCGHLFRYIQGV